MDPLSYTTTGQFPVYIERYTRTLKTDFKSKSERASVSRVRFGIIII